MTIRPVEGLLLAIVWTWATSPSAALAQRPEPLAAPVIAAERAFAADAAEIGWAEAFRRWHAEGALVLAPDPIAAAESLARIDGPGETTLDWRPVWAGIARSGDFGFTTGPFHFRGREGIGGHYFTVWRRRPDGVWRWIFDAGTNVVDPGPLVAADAAIPTLPVAAREGSAESAIRAVERLELEHATLGALADQLAEEARVNRPAERPAVGRADGATLFAKDAAATHSALRREAASSGDMVFSLGEVRDAHEGAERLRYYARVWQLQPSGWRIVFDELVPRPTPGG
jgi:ketosteroid isomerase-like protein